MVQGLKVTMKKHPSAFKLTGHLADLLKTVGETALTLYEGLFLSAFIFQEHYSKIIGVPFGCIPPLNIATPQDQ